MGEVTQEKHPVDGHLMDLRKDVKIPEKMADYGTFEATETERVPLVYLIPPGHKEAVRVARGARRPPRPPRRHAVDGPSKSSRSNRTPRRQTLSRTIASARSPGNGSPPSVPSSRRHGPRPDEPAARPARVLPSGAAIGRWSGDWNFLDSALGSDVKVYPILRSKN